MKDVCVDKWSISDAWESCYGEPPQFPLEAVPVVSERYTECDHVVAAYFGEVTNDTLAKARAAVSTIYPWLALQPLPSACKTRTQTADYLKSVVPEIVKEHAIREGIPRSRWRTTVSALKRWDIQAVDFWFIVWDSLGLAKRDTMELEDFYKFAGMMLRYTESGAA